MNRPNDQSGRTARFLRIHPKRMRMIWLPDCSDEQPHDQVGEFRAENPVAILRAVTLTDGACSAVASKAQEYGSTVLASTLDEWIQEGREDLIAGDTETDFARFATAFDERKSRPNGNASG